MLRFAAIGLAAGLFGAILGVGGGIIVVPLLAYLFHYDARQAAGTSMGAIAFTATVGAILYAIQGHQHPADAALLGIPAGFGVLVGTAVQQRLPLRMLSLLFAALVLVVGVRLLEPDWFGFQEVQHRTWWVYALAIAIGCMGGVLAGLFGIGGGILFVPTFVLLLALSQLDAAATSLLAMLPDLSRRLAAAPLRQPRPARLARDRARVRGGRRRRDRDRGARSRGLAAPHLRRLPGRDRGADRLARPAAIVFADDGRPAGGLDPARRRADRQHRREDPGGRRRDLTTRVDAAADPRLQDVRLHPRRPAAGQLLVESDLPEYDGSETWIDSLLKNPEHRAAVVARGARRRRGGRGRPGVRRGRAARPGRRRPRPLPRVRAAAARIASVAR